MTNGFLDAVAIIKNHDDADACETRETIKKMQLDDFLALISGSDIDCELRGTIEIEIDESV